MNQTHEQEYHKKRSELYVLLGKLVDAWAKADHFSYYVFSECIALENWLENPPGRNELVDSYFNDLQGQKFQKTKNRVAEANWISDESKHSIQSVLVSLDQKLQIRKKFIHGLYSFDSPDGQLIHFDMSRRTDFTPTPDFALEDLEAHVEEVYHLVSELFDEFRCALADFHSAEQ